MCIATIKPLFMNTEALLGEVSPLRVDLPDAVVCFPLNVVRVDTSLKDEIFQQAPDLVVGKRGDDCGPHIEAASELRVTLAFTATFQAVKDRAVRVRPSPGSSRSMISPVETQPYLQSAAGLVCKALMNDHKRMVNVCDGKA